MTLQEILDKKEKRAARQAELLDIFRVPLVSFTMNIPGEEKCSEAVFDGYGKGLFLLTSFLDFLGTDIVNFEEEPDGVGPEAYISADCDPVLLKKLTCAIEEAFPAGRLFDFDVICPDGRKISRTELGLPERKCLICDDPARVCARTGKHSYEELAARAAELLEESVSPDRASLIADLAVLALLFEAATTPKPGLVDLDNSGAHCDMDFMMFSKSAGSLHNYFRTAALAADFSSLRKLGLEAEKKMLSVTGGVNTHKGAVFSVGLICSALGKLSDEDIHDSRKVLDTAGEMAGGIVKKDLGHVTMENAVAAGEKIYAQYGITGIRGEAEGGFNSVKTLSIPVVVSLLKDGYTLNEAGRTALLNLIAGTDDTNLIKRGGYAESRRVRERVIGILEKEECPQETELKALDMEFTKKNLSPGGCADLLSVTYLLCLADNYM